MRRRQKRRGGFLAGMIAGVAAGVAGGMWLLRSQGEEIEIVAGDERRITAPVSTAPPVRRPLTLAAQPPTSLMDQLQQRWELAVREGRKAAAARRLELERELARNRKEVTVDLIAASHIDEVSGRTGETGGQGSAP